MHYYLYEIRNNINGKIYIGVHKTEVIDDGYMGSGKVIKRAIEKYGIENFTKTILETFDSSESMFACEKEIDTDEFLLREDTYNLRRGGTGGFDYVNSILTAADRSALGKAGCFTNKHLWSVETQRKWKTIATATMSRLREEWKADERIQAILVDSRQVGSINALSEKSRNKKKETYKKISHQQGEKNSQFGKVWITNGVENKTIKRTACIPDGWTKGRKINGR